MTTTDKVKIIQEQLEQVQTRILENKKLQEEYPEQKRGLLIGLATLKHLEADMFETLKDEYVINNHEVYEIYLTGMRGHSIPIKDLGQILIDQQATITSFGSEKPLKLNASFPTDLTNKTQMNLLATASGSFRIILATTQKVLMDGDNAESTVKTALNDIQKLIECGSNKELLRAEESTLGSKKIATYKDLLRTLYEKNINMEISTRTSNKENIPIFNIKKDRARTIYDALIARENPDKDTVEMTGVLDAVDFTTKIDKFKIVIKKGNKEKSIPVRFSDDLEDDVVIHLRKLSIVIVKRTINKKGVGEKEFIEYHLINFEDN